MGNSARRDTRAAETQERRRRALTLRRDGLSYDAIARKMGVSVSVAHAYVHDAIRDIPAPEAEATRTIELERLDRLQAGLWARATKGDPKAVGAVLRVMDRRAKLLGLDAPQKTEITGPDGGPVQVTPADARRALRELFRDVEPAGGGADVGSPREGPSRT